MSQTSFHLVLAGVAAFGLVSCSTPTHKAVDDAQYWQRAAASSALYMRGPKAQQKLHKDISNCVVELRELDRLGALRYATPSTGTTYQETPDPDTPAGELAQWQAPEREGMLRIEHLTYHDFEGCMHAKGWERVEHMPYDIAEQSREIYVESILGQQYRTGNGLDGFKLEHEEGDFADLND